MGSDRLSGPSAPLPSHWYLIFLPQVSVAPIFYGLPNKVQPKVFDSKVHVSKPENEASEKKEGNLRFVMSPEKGEATSGSGLLIPGAVREKPDAGKGPGEDQEQVVNVEQALALPLPQLAIRQG